MSLIFGCGKLTVSGVAIARLHNVNLTITYDNAVMRGDNRIFPDHISLYNGAVEGSWEWGEMVVSGLSDLLGGTATVAGGSGTWVLSATQFPTSAVQMIFSGVTDGITCTVTLKAVKVNSLALNFDRENYMMPAGNFVCMGDATNKDVISIQL